MERKFYENSSSLKVYPQLPKLLLEASNFQGHKLVEWNVAESKTDFGFMSSIFEAQLITIEGEVEHRHELIIKVMKGSEEFRCLSQSYLQFQNEIYLYDNILPHFNSYLVGKGTAVNLTEWLPETYLSFSENGETILVQKNIQKNDFFVEQSLFLDEQHLNIMVECLAQFHAVSLAMKVENEKEFSHLVDGIQPLCFEQSNGLPSLYDVLHEIATTRLFDYVFSHQNDQSGEFIRDINRLKEVVGDKPVKLLDRFREIDDFAVIGHGDYHRNNILFRKMNNNCVVDMKMIDFQQIRYGSPCLDLSFFMYLNVSAELRESLWDKMLLRYHHQLIKYTAEILNTSPNDPKLSRYSYVSFVLHCKRFFLYGTLISASFTPWLLTSKSETDKIAHLFQTNMFDQEYREFALVVGGEAADRRIIGNMKHASERGYMKMLFDVK